MDRVKTEESACSAVKELLFEMPGVQPYINSNDRGPSWDGNIYISLFDDGSKKNLSKIPTQIKGHREDAKGKQEISFPVEVIDLDNYYRNSGCFFFVVYISPVNHKKRTIFYSSLLPYDLRLLLQDKKGQKTISIKMKRFPSDKMEGYNVLLNFTHNAVLQTPLCLISDDNFAKACNLNQGNAALSLSYKFVGNNCWDPLFYLPAYQYRESGFGTKIPIGKQDNIVSVEFEVTKPVCCAGKTYFNSFRCHREPDIIEIKIGAGISVIRNEKEKTQVFNYVPKGSLAQRISDMDFFLTMIQFGSFDLGKEKIAAEIIHPLSAEKKQEEMDRLNYLKKLQQAFLNAGYKGVVDIDAFTDEDWNKCDVLISAFINKKSNFCKKDDGIGFFVFTIGNVSLLLLIIQKGDKKQVLNPYTSFMQAEIQGADGKIPISAFCLLNEENLRKVSKFDFDAVMKNIQAIPFSKEFHDFLIQLLLKMLRASDSGANDPDMLLYSNRLAQWLVEQDDNSIVDQINLYQVFKRQRELLPDEISALHKLLESAEISNELKAGIYILLSDWGNFSEHFGKLTPAQQKIFIDYPIFHLLPCEVRNQWLE